MKLYWNSGLFIETAHHQDDEVEQLLCQYGPPDETAYPRSVCPGCLEPHYPALRPAGHFRCLRCGAAWREPEYRN